MSSADQIANDIETNVPRLKVDLHPLTSWALLSALQIALRSDLPPRTRHLLDTFAHALQGAITTTPILQAAADLGWDPTIHDQAHYDAELERRLTEEPRLN